MNAHSIYQFSLMRILIAFAIFLHFLTLWPFLPELSHMASAYNSHLDFGITFKNLGLPNVFDFVNSKTQIRFFFWLSTVLSIALCVGFAIRLSALVLLYFYICTTHVLPLIPNPHTGFLAWSLLFIIFMPCLDPLRFSLKNTFDKAQKVPIKYVSFFQIAYLLGLLYSAFLLKNVLAICLVSLGLVFLHRTWACLVGLALAFAAAIFYSPVLLLSLIALIPFYNFPSRKPSSEKVIVFVDGVCSLCNSLVAFLVQEDRNKVFHFAALQGETAKCNLSEKYTNQLSSVVLLDAGKEYTQSQAILRIFVSMGGIWMSFSIFYLVPNFIRNIIYNLIARYRYAIFGKKEICSLPDVEEKMRLLD